MGYNHYWHREEEIQSSLFEGIALEFERLILPLEDAGSDWPGTTAVGYPKSIIQELLSTVSGIVGIPRILTYTSLSLVTLQAELAFQQMRSTVRIRYSWN